MRPIEDRGLGAVSLDEFEGVRLDLVSGPRTPNDQPSHRLSSHSRTGGGRPDRGSDIRREAIKVFYRRSAIFWKIGAVKRDR
jgi:hypothetical protein